ncbi:MAG: hypothetical protein K2K57_08325 [Oscillospiraceae bacterium]|nr:hypothetical protein [Oscillospiraceae bacterium]
MKFRKIICFGVAFALACGLAAGVFETLSAEYSGENTVYALTESCREIPYYSGVHKIIRMYDFNAEDINPDEADVQRVVSEIKKRVEIPDRFKEYECEAVTANGVIYYNVTWYGKIDPPYEWETISVEYCEGLIYGYEHTDNTYDEKPTFAKLTLTQQDACAEKYFYMLNPDIDGEAVFERESPEYSLDSNVLYIISRKEQGIEISSVMGYIVIDRNTGGLAKFFLYRWDWMQGAEFPDSSNRISEEEARDIYISQSSSSVEYTLFYDIDYDRKSNGTIKTIRPYAVPLYCITGDVSMINAVTGESSTVNDDIDELSCAYSYKWFGGFADDFECGLYDYTNDETYVSPVEEELFNKQKEGQEQLTDEQAVDIIRNDACISFDNRLALVDKSFEYTRDDNAEIRFLRYMRFEDEGDKNNYLSVYMDGYSGEIFKFNKRGSKNDTPLDEKTAVTAAKNAAMHFLGSKASEYRYEESLADALADNDTKGTVVLTRYVYGIPAYFDKIYVKLNSLGEVTDFEYSCHDITFPKGTVISKEEAYNRLFEKERPQLYFAGFTDPQMNSHTYYIYEFDSTYYLDPFTGERMTSEGEPYYKKQETEKKQGFYPDAAGHKYEKEIRELYRYGVRLGEEELLRPDDPITVNEFFELCRQLEIAYFSWHEIYDDIRITDPETGEKIRRDNPKNDEPLTYSGLARLYVRYYADEEHSPSLKANYKQPYKNVTKDNPDYAYIAIAKKQGYISKGDEFDCNKTLTRGECMKIIYDYIAQDGEAKPLYEIFKI